jgi:hypothetical protein
MKTYGIILAMAVGLALGFSLGRSLNPFQAQPEQQRMPSSEKSHSTVTCRMMTTDFGEIIGRGADRNAAMADAAQKCYLRRESQFESVRKTRIDKERGEDLIISCINLPCRYEVANR